MAKKNKKVFAYEVYLDKNMSLGRNLLSEGYSSDIQDTLDDIKAWINETSATFTSDWSRHELEYTNNTFEYKINISRVGARMDSTLIVRFWLLKDTPTVKKDVLLWFGVKKK